ncbi:MAG TPA: PIN domain-containing protein [Chthonomonadaceae bacterium]|nr:PIN domain-containing protein [Chthonomonadaceae bacterium]
MLPTQPPRYLLDTDILVHYVRNDALSHWIENRFQLRASPAAPLICIVTAGELRSLALQLGWGGEKRGQLDQIINDCVVIPLDFPGLVEAYADIDAYSRQVGGSRGENDMWIAAAARVTGTRLLTTDKDFDHLDPKFIHRDWIDPHQKLIP